MHFFLILPTTNFIFFSFIFLKVEYIHLNVSARFFPEKTILRILSCLFYGVEIILIPIKMKKLSLVVDQEFGPKIGLRPIFRPPFLRNQRSQRDHILVPRSSHIYLLLYQISSKSKMVASDNYFFWSISREMTLLPFLMHNPALQAAD